MNAKTCKRLRAAYPYNSSAYKKAKKLEKQRLAAMRSGQKPKLAEPRERTPKDPQPRASSAWRRTGPLVVQRSRRMTARDKRAFTSQPEAVDRLYWGYYPKHFLDRIALRHPVEVA